jgi:hypothetical protein
MICLAISGIIMVVGLIITNDPINKCKDGYRYLHEPPHKSDNEKLYDIFHN